MHDLSKDQYGALETGARISSLLSIVGVTLILTTIGTLPYFRKPINRLVAYASIGNLLANVATIISRDGLKSGAGKPLCLTQSFLIQAFLSADSLWTFCMAVNVYLSFFRNFTAAGLRSLERYYLVFCYGVPTTLAFILLMIDLHHEATIYGPATLWCWVTDEYEWMRVAFFYGPIWVFVVLTGGIYVAVGRRIARSRSHLRSFSNQLATNGANQNRVRRTISLMRGTDLSELNSSGTPAGSTAVQRPLTRRTEAMKANTAARAYFKVALIMFAASCITYVSKPLLPETLASSDGHQIPSTINRVYALADPEHNYALNLISAIVLPLQGFWNCVIYFSTSWMQCKQAYGDIAAYLGRVVHWKSATSMQNQEHVNQWAQRSSVTSEASTVSRNGSKGKLLPSMGPRGAKTIYTRNKDLLDFLSEGPSEV